MTSRRDRIRATVGRAMTEDLSDQMVAGEAQPANGGDTEVMVGRGLRLPLEVDRAFREIAADRGMAPSSLIRQWIEAGVAGERADAAVVPLAELQEAIAKLTRKPAAA
jgi:hypothetical protein